MTALRVSLDVTPLLGPPTGIARFVSGVLPHLAEDDTLEMSGWVLSLRGGQLSPASPVPVRRVRLPARAVHRMWAAGHSVPLRAFRAPDVVHGTNFAAPPGPGSILTLHDLTPLAAERLPSSLRGRARLIRRAVATGTHLQVPTDHIRQRAIAELGAEPARVTAVPYGLDPIAATADGAGRRRAGADRYVLALGTVHRRKNLVRLAHAVAALPPDVGLVVAGPVGDDETAVAAALDDLGRTRPVRRFHDVDDRMRAELLRDASVLGYPSLDEGFGLPPLEAMSVDVPVVAGAAGSIPEVVADGAVLVDPTDLDALSQSLASVLEPEHRDALVRRGRAVAAGYGWNATAVALTALYRLVAADGC